MDNSWSLIAHGGAKDIAPDEEHANRAGLEDAIAIGSKILQDGGSAIDAVEQVVKSLEANPAYNAGLTGSVQNEEGMINMDASVMDGKTLNIGAVAGLRNIKHPVSVARALLPEKPVFLIGEGAQKFAEQSGFAKENDTNVPTTDNKGCDTVGCVARDQSGTIAVATSTGGLKGTKAGRVGDVPLPGCGFYADNMRGGVSASGEGESIARVMLASEFIHLLQDMSPNDATRKALTSLDKINGEAGLIAISAEGEIGWSHNSPNFAVGMAASSSSAKVYLKKSEEK